jgi:hypothetical protein
MAFAMEMLLTAELVDAEQAHRGGLVAAWCRATATIGL